jgi:hypothetical protein
MDGINGAAWRLMIHIWALSPYGVLAGMLMFSNKQGMTALVAASRFFSATATRSPGLDTPRLPWSRTLLRIVIHQPQL